MITCLALRSPVIMVPLPLFQKCGFNPPLSGFLEEEEVAAVRTFLDDKSLAFLEAVAATDGFAQGAKRHFEGLPDITEEKLQSQMKYQKEILQDVNRRPLVESDSNSDTDLRDQSQRESEESA